MQWNAATTFCWYRIVSAAWLPTTRSGRCRVVATETVDSRTAKVTTWLTMGAPLGDESVKRRLNGADAEKFRRYPNNILSWLNVAAEDDYACHDDRLANDYAGMLEQRLISRIEDARIYNLAVRYGRSNPHNAYGYLTHPRVTRAIAKWLGQPIASQTAR
jgi:hypothetical protein